jgi:tRNA1(Val) A37 N6-methylase TrmN6
MIAGGHVKGKKEMIAAELAIRDEKEEYTNEFIDLLKDYYLFL